jgi:osmotically-inducible protein OsmY
VKTLGLTCVVLWLALTTFAADETPVEATLAVVDAPSPELVPDPVLVQKVNDGLRATRRAGFDRLKVAAAEGVVGLSGEVRTLQEKALAEAVARTMPGVRGVQSRLKVADSFRRPVAPNDPRGLAQIAHDEKLRERVLRRAARVSGVRPSQIQVEVYHGVAVVSGLVPTAAHIERLRQAAAFTKDISAVVLNVQVEPPPKPPTSPPAQSSPE